MFDDNQDNTQQDNQAQPVVTPDVPATDAAPDDTPQQQDGTGTAAPASAIDSDLLEIKRSALQDLSPLLDQLDQEPEERFQTTMMMVQATDDKSLVPKAYEAAKQIKKDKERAQALLDIVNEINYFTQGK